MEHPDESGASFIPATQRPDGTWRKARRVKDGYVPQEEVPLYESKGKKFMSKQLQPEDGPVKVDGLVTHKTIPGLFIEDKPSKKERKRAAKVEQLARDLKKMDMNGGSNGHVDPSKKLKNLKKRLREVEALEAKIKSGELAKPDPDQLAKVARKNELILKIQELEN